MKQKLITIILLYAQTVLAQQMLTYQQQAPQDGHRLQRLQVELPTGAYQPEQHLWDFSRMRSLEENSRQRYYQVGDSTLHRMGCMEKDMHYYEDLSGDSILLAGYENRQTRVDYDRKEVLMRFPMLVGDSVEGFFHGRGMFCNRIALRHYGRYHTKVTDYGNMILPEGDTLRNVLLLHTERSTAMQYYPDIYHDSLTVYTIDSVRAHLLKDSVLMTTTVNRWYAHGYRYPILEERQVCMVGDEAPTVMALYYAPCQQEELDDDYNASIRGMSAASYGKQKGIGHTSDNESGANSPLHNVSAGMTGKTVTVSYEVDRDATIHVLICNVQGMVIRQSAETATAGSTCQQSVYCGGLGGGNYVLNIKVDDKTLFSCPLNL